jgi:hypothetical protein
LVDLEKYAPAPLLADVKSLIAAAVFSVRANLSVRRRQARKPRKD